ncbi:MAG: GIY-YIG nuclease family protein [Prevotellaceae bacterium]|jgi:hypothetical protein|nr:GIY-YIG nuclease family protein [Prevotellaceae bacterium]
MKQQTNQGIVYVLTNPAMPDLVKIGMTTRNNIEERMRELYGTGVPVPFECRYACQVKSSDCLKIEKALHTAFAPNRINANREFFQIKPEQAIAILELFNRTDITHEVTKEIEDDLTDVDRVASENLKRTARRPPLNYKAMNIPVGAKLVYLRSDTPIEVEVCSEKKVIYNGEETSLTAVTTRLLGSEYSVQPTPYWSYNGKNLQDIYNDTYSSIE